MKEIRHLKTIKNKRNLNTKWLLLQNDQNADTTLLHSHADMYSFFNLVLLLMLLYNKNQSFLYFNLDWIFIRANSQQQQQRILQES